MNFLKKWYTYQKERFPVLVYGLYIFCIVFGVFCYTNYFGKIDYEDKIKDWVFIRAVDPYTINYLSLISMFIVAFLQFLMVRIIDEFKDYEEDCKYRPYRPVPRGLISLKELKILFIICAIIQIGITLILRSPAIVFLIFLWIFFAIMSKGFFIKKFLDKHILLEVLLDELMLPFLILYLSNFIYFLSFKDLVSLLVIGYIISWIVEIARKVRCKEDEEEGVKTYTAVFGIPKAVFILVVLETLLAFAVYNVLGSKFLIHILVTYIVINLFNLLFIIEKKKIFAKACELSANLYIMLAYLSLGLLIF